MVRCFALGLLVSIAFAVESPEVLFPMLAEIVSP
jgi:hypothetical protein